MTAFKKTIAGKILRGIGKVAGVAVPVVGTALGIGAISGIIKGAGAVKGAVGAAAKIKSTVSKVAQGAVGLVTGTTKSEREQLQVIKSESKAALDQLQQVERLVNAGATRARAELMVGVTPTQLGSAEAEEKEREISAIKEAPEPLKAAVGCLTTILVLLSGLAGFILSILLIF